MSEQTKELHRTAGRLSITNDDYVAKMLHDAAETITAQQAAIGQLRDTLVIQMRCTKKDMAYIDEVEAENAKLKGAAQAVVEYCHCLEGYPAGCDLRLLVDALAALLGGEE